MLGGGRPEFVGLAPDEVKSISKVGAEGGDGKSGAREKSVAEIGVKERGPKSVGGEGLNPTEMDGVGRGGGAEGELRERV